MQRASSNAVVSPFKNIEVINSPMTYTNDTFACEQIFIDGGVGVALEIGDGVGGYVSLTNTNCFVLRPFSHANIKFVVAPTAIKAMVL